MKRRLVLGALSVLVVTSGCLGALTGGESTYEAAPADVTEAAAAETGFEKNGTRDSVTTREVDATSGTVRVVSKVTTYDKSLEVPLLGSARLGVFRLVSTPAVEIAGRSYNPVGDYSNDRLARFAAEQSRSLSAAGIERVSSRRVLVLGTETTVTKYAATTNVQGQEIDVFLHVTKVCDGEDFVVAIGVYPQTLDQQAEVLTLLRAIEHPVMS
jgi:hypothetical protein